MLDIFTYPFMQKAFIVGILISVITALIGVIIVLKRLSNIGDALSHNSLAGVAFGLFVNINPILSAILFSVFAAFSIEKLRKSFSKYGEISTAIILSTGIALAGIFSSFGGGSGNINNFLFGSIVAISDFELYLVIILSLVVTIVMIFLYKELFYITFDEECAKIAGIPVKAIDFVFTILIALTISIASRTIGTLVVSSLMVIPVACAIQISKSYKETVINSILFSISFTILGLFVSYYLNLKPGSTIILIGVITIIFIIAYKNTLIKRILKSKLSGS